MLQHTLLVASRISDVCNRVMSLVSAMLGGPVTGDWYLTFEYPGSTGERKEWTPSASLPRREWAERKTLMPFRTKEIYPRKEPEMRY